MRFAPLTALACALVLAAAGSARAQSGQALVDGAGRGDVVAVRAQLKRGAPVEARDARNWTALMVASARGHADVVRTLLAAGADPNPRAPDGSTPLMAAAVGGHTEIVRALLDAHADPSLRNQAGATARSKALEYGHTDLAAFLEAREATLARPAAAPLDTGPFSVEAIDEVHILARDAGFRREPTFAAPVVGQLPRGVTLRVTGRVVGRPWYRVGPPERAVYVESDAVLQSTP